MHDGCSGNILSGKEIADKVRMMGFDRMPVANPLDLKCTHCDGTFKMETMVSQCPQCRMVYAVTPCHSHSAESVMPAGVDY